VSLTPRVSTQCKTWGKYSMTKIQGENTGFFQPKCAKTRLQASIILNFFFRGYTPGPPFLRVRRRDGRVRLKHLSERSAGIPVPAGLPDPTRTRGFGSGRVNSPRVRVGSGRCLTGTGKPVLPVKKFTRYVSSTYYRW
jgi:hypothetical protein